MASPSQAARVSLLSHWVCVQQVIAAWRWKHMAEAELSHQVRHQRVLLEAGWCLNAALPPNRGFQTPRTHDRAWGDSGQRGHTASTPLSVQGAFLALPRSLDS